MQKYIGSIIDIIYLDRHGQFTQRRIRIKSIQGTMIRAYDIDQRTPRVFNIDNVLAMQQVRSA